MTTPTTTPEYTRRVIAPTATAEQLAERLTAVLAVMLLVDPVRVPNGMAKPAPPEVIAMAMTRSSGDTQVMILLGALAGLRRSEIAKLQRGDIYLDGEPPVIHVRHGKGDTDAAPPEGHLLAVPDTRGKVQR